MTRQEKIKLLRLKKEKLRRESKNDYTSFCRYMDSSMMWSDFHKTYYKIVNMFAQGKIKKLIITVPPQHGKSENVSRKLPAYLLGNDPDKMLALCSYNQTFVRKFARAVKKNIICDEFKGVFEETRIKQHGFKDFNDDGTAINTADEFEIIGKKGRMMFVGRGGGITGNTIDIAILDDIFKGYSEASSPLIREKAWDWYLSEVRTRLHNDSQQLITFTRWDEDDTIGRLEQLETVITINSWEELEDIPENAWVKVNFEALKQSEPTEIDPRQIDEPLWVERHNYNKLNEERKLSPAIFEALYQGNPTPKEGYLWQVDEFKTYEQLPRYKQKFNYTDTADTGKDKLCSINYIEYQNQAYVTDVYYTSDSMEITEEATAKMLINDNVNLANVESNNGGRGFARNVNKLTPANIAIKWFHQGQNKESRIHTNSASVQTNIIFPKDWKTMWPEFYNDIKMYKKDFKANKHDDGADTLTGIIEKMAQGSQKSSSGKANFRI